MSTLASELLRRRCRSHGGDPLVTYYDLGSGERTELSAITVGNWVAKTANLVLDEIGAEPGDRISLPLAVAAPGHWLTFVWELACWQTGVVVDLTDPEGEAAVVTGPEWEPYEWRRAYACALHPMGFGFSEPLAAGVTDFAVEVRAQPDSYLGTEPDPGREAWHDAERTLTQTELTDVPGAAERRLVVPTDPWSTVRDALLAPLVGGGSAVVVLGGTPDQIAHVAETERVAP